MAAWVPELEQSPSPLYQRISDALERDIASGALAAGTRLPPQRILADAMQLSVGTVTKAYVEAERRGLVAGHVGRGTFVAAGPANRRAETAAADRPIDLSLNTVLQEEAARRLPETLNALRRRPALLDALAYSPPAGEEPHRRVAAAWIERTAGYAADWTRLVMTTGAQQAMAFATGAVCPPGAALLCEEATFYGIKSLAEHRGYRLEGVAMDAEGLLPAALDKAARATGARALYTMPSVQNPTGRTMGRARREEIVRIARKHDIWIIEDDIYALFGPAPSAHLARIAELAPERTFYVSGVSKSLAPGLRTGFLVCPDEAMFEAVLRAMRATIYAPSALGPMIFAEWVADGSAAAIADAQCREIAERHAVARRILGGWMEPGCAPAPHVWLPMAELDAERVAGRALRAGVRITPPSAPFVAGRPVSGLRLCIGGPPSRTELERALALCASAMAAGMLPAEGAVV